MDLTQFVEILVKKCFVLPNSPIVIGVSGGADSLSLLDLMNKSGLPIIVGHLNHNLRAEADNEAEILRKFCKDRSLPCFFKKIDIRDEAKSRRQSIEEAGRKARYHFLFQLADEKNAQSVAVAHNRDDQVETILMHLIRGSGLTGLRGMDYHQIPNEWSTTIPLIRPLLDYPKAEILNYCHEKNLNYSIDKTNEDRTYYRNQIRMDLVPYLESYNPKIRNRLVSMSEVFRQEDDFLEKETHSAMTLAISEKGTGYFLIDRQGLLGFHAAIIRRVLYSLMKRLKPTTANITFETIDTASRFLFQPSKSGRISLVAGIEIIHIKKESILLIDTEKPLDDLWPQIQGPIALSLDANQKVCLNGNWRLEFMECFSEIHKDPWCACLDAEKITHLYLDRFKPGDRFSPFGMQGKTIKLGDYWTNEGLPHLARSDWPLLRSGKNIVWVPGFTIDDNYKITDSTQSRMSIRIFKE